MNIYTVHVNPDAAAPQAEAVFVREGFSLAAFFLQPLWALYHGLWLVAALVFVAIIVLSAVIGGLGLTGWQSFALQLLFAVFIGAEAQDFRRWTLRRRGFDLRAVVAGEHLDEAEDRYFRTELRA